MKHCPPDRAAAFRRHLPSIGGRLDEHGSRDCTRFAQWGPERTNGRRPACGLNAERRIGIKLLVWRRVMEHDLSDVCVELFGQDRRDAGVDSLPHFDLWHDQRYLAGFVDTDKRVWRERSARGILWLFGVGSAEGEMERKDETGCQCATEKAPTGGLRHCGRDSHDDT